MWGCWYPGDGRRVAVAGIREGTMYQPSAVQVWFYCSSPRSWVRGANRSSTGKTSLISPSAAA
jgi:hypothetical protein